VTRVDRKPTNSRRPLHATVLAAVVCSSIALSAPPAGKPAASTKPTIAVLNLKNTAGVSAGEAEVISDRLRNEIFRTGVVDVMERDQMQAVLAEQGFQKSGACTDEGCMVEIGQLLGVKSIVTGSLGKLGSMFMINMRAVDVQTGKLTRAISKDIKGDIEELVDILPELAGQLVGSDTPAPPPRPQPKGKASASPAPEKTPDPAPAPVNQSASNQTYTKGAKIYLELGSFGKPVIKFVTTADQRETLTHQILEGLDDVFEDIEIVMAPADRIPVLAGKNALIVRIKLNSYVAEGDPDDQEGTVDVTLLFFNGPTATKPAFTFNVKEKGSSDSNDVDALKQALDAAGDAVGEDLGDADFIKDFLDKQ